jgi:hypothetical protein
MVLPTFIALKTILHGKIGFVVATSAWVAFAALAITEALQGQIIVALITAIPPTGAVVVTAIALLRGQRAMHLQMNSRLDELVEARRGVARAEGVEQERSEERNRRTGSSSVQDVSDQITKHDLWERENAATIGRAKVDADAVKAKAVLKKEGK